MDSAVQRQLLEFLSTLDLNCRVERGYREEKAVPELLLTSIGEESQIEDAARQLEMQALEYQGNENLVGFLVQKLREKPETLFLLMYLFRQVRFTVVETVYFLFEIDRLNDLNYYLGLEQSDPDFKQQVMETLTAKWTINLLGAQTQNLSEAERLFVYKTTVFEYAGKQKPPHHLWISRVKNDDGVRKRIAHFIVENEGFRSLVKNRSVVGQLLRNIRQVNVESIKWARGKLGAEKIENILKESLRQATFRRTTLEELHRLLVSGEVTVPSLSYVKEIRSPLLNKQVDCALIDKTGVKFAIESNYFTAGMSKPRSVAGDFQRLSENCLKAGFGFIYVSDGIAWISIDKVARELITHSESLKEKNPGGIPLFMNLDMFRRSIPRIITTMAR